MPEVAQLPQSSPSSVLHLQNSQALQKSSVSRFIRAKRFPLIFKRELKLLALLHLCIFKRELKPARASTSLFFKLELKLLALLHLYNLVLGVLVVSQFSQIA